MKVWLMPALLMAAVAGYTIGRSTASGHDPVAPTAPNKLPAKVEMVPPTPSLNSREATGEIPVPLQRAVAAKSPRQRLVEALASHLDVDKLYSALWQAALRDPKLQREIFDLIRTTEDTGLMEQCQVLLSGIKEPQLLKEVLAAFEAEKNPERKLFWAYVVGANWDKAEARSKVFEVLEGSDSRLQERLLRQMCLQQLQWKGLDGEIDRASEKLRLLVQAGEGDAVREMAAHSLRGVQKPDDIAFLIDAMLHDRSGQVQTAAFHSLPSNYQSPSPLLAEQTRAMYQAAIDEQRPQQLRKMCASRALQNAISERFDEEFNKTLSPQELATLEAIAGKTKEE